MGELRAPLGTRMPAGSAHGTSERTGKGDIGSTGHRGARSTRQGDPGRDLDRGVPATPGMREISIPATGLNIPVGSLGKDMGHFWTE